MNSNSSENKYQAGRKPTSCNPEETCPSQGSGRMERGKGGESFGLWGRIKKCLLIDDNESIFYNALVVMTYCLVVVYFAVVVNYIATLRQVASQLQLPK